MEKILKKILAKENIAFDKITKSNSGFTNLVYFIDDKFVIKLSNYKKTKEKLSKEILIYKNIKIDNIPKFVTSGNLEDFTYLIISKIKGNSLYSIWHNLTKFERQDCISQIASILKSFHSQNYHFLDNCSDFDWLKYISDKIYSKCETLKNLNFNTLEIEKFVTKKFPLIFNKNNFALIYNDAHFDNFIYDNKTLYLIDFDRSTVCPTDYEMMIFSLMCDNPSKFANEQDEENINIVDYVDIYTQFKTFYPELFEIKYIDIRVYIYKFDYLLGQAIDIKDLDWINKLLIEFNSKLLNKKDIL